MSALMRGTLLGLAMVAFLPAPPALARQTDHSTMDHSKMKHPPAAVPAPAKPVTKPKPKPKPNPKAKTKPAPPPADPHAGHVMPPPADPHAGHVMPPPADPHAGHVVDPAPANAPRTPIPELTAADRAAAFPELKAHPAHDRSRHAYWLVDRLEARDADGGIGLDWKASAWIGGDVHRVWLRSEGESADGRIEGAEIEVLAGRAISPWWDLVAGIRHDFGEAPDQSFVAVGVVGLAPYKIEIEATAYLGSSGQAAARFEAGYETLLSNRLILQWHAEADLHAKEDALRGVGAGLSTLEAGIRLRYEVTRQFAPYVGVSWERAFGDTARLRRSNSDEVDDARLVAGVRMWF